MIENAGTAVDLYYSSAWQLLEERVGGNAKKQYVWSQVYIDAMILRDRDADGNGSLEERLYAQQDANFNITAIINTNGAVQERFALDAYGQPTFLNASWTTQSSSASDWVYLHQGGRWQVIGGTYHFRNRDLSATLGRWLQVDPAGFGGRDLNLYRAYQNVSMRYRDPSGLKPQHHHWFPQFGGAGQNAVNAICGNEPFVNIDWFTTTLENSHTNSPHWYAHHGLFSDWYISYAADIMFKAKSCCDLITGIIGLMEWTWIVLSAANASGQLSPPLGAFNLHAHGRPQVDTTARLLNVWRTACKGTNTGCYSALLGVPAPPPQNGPSVSALTEAEAQQSRVRCLRGYPKSGLS